jgi:hypothetical protein
MLVRVALLPVLGIAALSLADCGPSATEKHASAAATPAGPQWATAPNACDVLNEATAKKLLGDSAKLLRKAQDNPSLSQCQYTSANGQISIMVGDWRMIHTANPQDKPFSGLGDEAYDSPSGVYVRKGAVGMSVNVIIESGEFWGDAADNALAQMSAAEKKVAVAVLPNL